MNKITLKNCCEAIDKDADNSEQLLDTLESKPTRILLVDDDPTFCKVISRYAKHSRCELRTCGSFQKLKVAWQELVPDVLVVDYNLGSNFKGTAIAPLIGAVPMLLISGTSHWRKQEPILHTAIKGFHHKKYGASTILDGAQTIAEKFS